MTIIICVLYTLSLKAFANMMNVAAFVLVGRVVLATVRQRICTDAELSLLSLQQSIKGSDLNACIQINPDTKLATSISLKSCLMSAGATELCASCFASVNEAFSQCVIICEKSGPQSQDCGLCFDTIQAAYELDDDQMATYQFFDTCRTGFANERGEMQTTGAPLTTTLPPVQISNQVGRVTGPNNGAENMFNHHHAYGILTILLIISLS